LSHEYSPDGDVVIRGECLGETRKILEGEENLGETRKISEGEENLGETRKISEWYCHRKAV